MFQRSLVPVQKHTTMAHNPRHGASESGQNANDVSSMARLQSENDMLQANIRQLQAELADLKNILAAHKCRPTCVEHENLPRECPDDQVE